MTSFDSSGRERATNVRRFGSPRASSGSLRSFAFTATLALVAGIAFGCSNAMQYEVEDYGWEHVVLTSNTDLPVDAPMGKATHRIAGHTLREIVTDPEIRIRADDKPCANCHAWSKKITLEEFCKVKVAAFDKLPTATGRGNDPPNAKPRVLKELFYDWRSRFCPE
jgi:hypothetical protein